jgi:hypothetical protein
VLRRPLRDGVQDDGVLDFDFHFRLRFWPI